MLECTVHDHENVTSMYTGVADNFSVSSDQNIDNYETISKSHNDDEIFMQIIQMVSSCVFIV